MGAMVGCSGNKNRELYIESDFKTETEMREWEFQLDSYEKSFFRLISKFNSKLYSDCFKIPKQNVLNFFKKLFPQGFKTFEEILDQKIFYIADDKVRNYDSDKIKCLLFLMTNSKPMSNTNRTQDKAKFLYFVVNEDENESPILRDNFNLSTFFKNLVLISCAIVSILEIN